MAGDLRHHRANYDVTVIDLCPHAFMYGGTFRKYRVNHSWFVGSLSILKQLSISKYPKLEYIFRPYPCVCGATLLIIFSNAILKEVRI